MNHIKRILCMALVLVLLAGSIPMSAFASGEVKYGIAFVNAKELRLRSKASTDSKILDTAYTAEAVVVLSKQGEWYKVNYNLQDGWMHEEDFS